jgi:hypothetical protein
LSNKDQQQQEVNAADPPLSVGMSVANQQEQAKTHQLLQEQLHRLEGQQAELELTARADSQVFDDGTATVTHPPPSTIVISSTGDDGDGSGGGLPTTTTPATTPATVSSQLQQASTMATTTVPPLEGVTQANEDAENTGEELLLQQGQTADDQHRIRQPATAAEDCPELETLIRGLGLPQLLLQPRNEQPSVSQQHVEEMTRRKVVETPEEDGQSTTMPRGDTVVGVGTDTFVVSSEGDRTGKGTTTKTPENNHLRE